MNKMFTGKIMWSEICTNGIHRLYFDNDSIDGEGEIVRRGEFCLSKKDGMFCLEYPVNNN